MPPQAIGQFAQPYLRRLKADDGIPVGDLLHPRERLVAGQHPVLDGGRAAGDQGRGEAAGSVFHQRLGHARQVAGFRGKGLGEPAQFSGICDGHFRVPAHRQGLQPFGAHHRPHTRTGGDPAPVVDDARDQGEALRGRADAGDTDFRVAEFGLKALFGRDGVLAPEVRGVPDFDPAVGDPQELGGGGHAGDEDGVEAGRLQLGAEIAAGVGIAPAAGQRRLAEGHIARAGRGLGAGQRPGGKAQDVLRSQRVNGFLLLLEEHPDAEAVAADEGAGQVVGQRLDTDGAGAQIHKRKVSHVSGCHVVVLLR